MRYSKSRRLVFAAWLGVGALAIVAVTSVVTGCQKPRSLEVLGQVPTFSFTDQEGRPFGSANLRGKVSVAAFMNTFRESIRNWVFN